MTEETKIKTNGINKGLVIAKILERTNRKNKRGETYYVLEVSIKRTATDRILELRNEEKVSANSKNPFFVFTNIGRNKYAYTLEKGSIYALWFTKTHNAENNEDYYHVNNWKKLSHDERSVERTLLLVLGKKPEEFEEEEEQISNEELLKELQRRKREGKISVNISAVSGDENSPLDLDVDLKDNESNFRVNLKEKNEEK